MKDLQFCRIHVVRRMFIAQIAQSAITDCVHTYVQYQTYMVLWYSTGRMYKYSTGQGFSDLVEIGQAAAQQVATQVDRVEGAHAPEHRVIDLRYEVATYLLSLSCSRPSLTYYRK